jgi:hypothetical protein
LIGAALVGLAIVISLLLHAPAKATAQADEPIAEALEASGGLAPEPEHAPATNGAPGSPQAAAQDLIEAG